MEPEKRARKLIDIQLEKAGWKVQNYKEINPSAGLGIAVREFPLKSGYADYLLFINRQAIGVVEAKKAGVTLSGVAEQSDKYLNAVPDHIEHINPLPFAYEPTGYETFFRDLRDPNPRSRLFFSFHQPQELEKILAEKETLRKRLQNMLELITEGLRKCQIEAIRNLEQSFSEARPRALIQRRTIHHYD